MVAQIELADTIARCLIYNRFFPGNIHTDKILFSFGASGPDGKAHESAVLRSLTPQEGDVHRAGCKIAASQNLARGEPPPGPERKYYCGFREACVGEMQLEDETWRVVLTNVPEHGEDAHVDVALELLVEGRSARSVARTDAGLALAEAFGPPLPHVCACDAADEEHPLVRLGPECLTSGLKDRWPNLRIEMPELASWEGGPETQT